ncbi:MAG TPA: pyrroline-5-carboxylate reductase [Candidatus Pygmaiobacter gallistercoris]|nr:pyrroline-5-carboxylate reductase [Candidatus Pygmaiobacter gallistercoris]
MLDTKNVKIGFIGFGNMAQAMAAGLLLRQAVEPGQLYACAKNWEKLRGNTEPRGIHPCRDAAELVAACDLVVVAVKPYLVAEVLAPVKEQLAGKILVSVAAGKPFDAYEEILAPGTHHLSTVPNTPISVGEGIIACERRHSLTDDEWALFSEIFGKTALIVPVETAQLSIAGTLAGCGPAFAAIFIEALADGAVKQGLPRALAYQLASQMVVGTGKLQLATGAHPGAMKDAVCSPGGTTIVGVAALERRGFRGAVIDAIDEIEHK